MLQVPCLSPPPIYGHSHYKKFWLRQNSEPGALEMKSSSTSSSPEPKRSNTNKQQQQQQQRRPPALKVDSIDISPSSSSGDWKMKRASDEELSTVENEEPKSFTLEDFNILTTSTLDPVEPKGIQDDPADHHPAPAPAAAPTPPDCLTSKCLESSKQDDSDSDSATSSTSQASDDHDHEEDSRKSGSFRQYLKRQTKEKPGDESHHHSQLQMGSPKATRQAASPLETGPGSSSSPRLASSSSSPVSNVSRTCKHCGTMKTPLWRNGPLGPKSLCNACGIRLRKARRNNNNENPSSGPSSGPNTPGSNSKRKAENSSATSEFSRQNSFKKSRVPVAREKRELGSIMRLLPQVKSSSSEKFGKQVSTDEEEGAVLLMALSCGLVLA